MQHAINERDVVVAIIGGTLLALALTRPKLDWVEKLEDSSRSTVEALITVVAFAMGGYAYGCLYIVLHRQLGGDINKLLRGAGSIPPLSTNISLNRDAANRAKKRSWM